MKCNDCVFRGEFQDMGASCDACTLQSDLVAAISACENSESCRHRFTVDEARKIVIEREGNPQIVPARRAEKRSETQTPLEDEFSEIEAVLCEKVQSVIESLKKLEKALKGEIK